MFYYGFCTNYYVCFSAINAIRRNHLDGLTIFWIIYFSFRTHNEKWTGNLFYNRVTESLEQGHTATLTQGFKFKAVAGVPESYQPEKVSSLLSTSLRRPSVIQFLVASSLTSLVTSVSEWPYLLSLSLMKLLLELMDVLAVEQLVVWAMEVVLSCHVSNQGIKIDKILLIIPFWSKFCLVKDVLFM